ncbi:hypothetical protein E2C01_078173 [Portunus trituberculatus]|uniref:Uncharacterized protein n=1 Tax=Portunus trituberculatus TaxID=210409 RepID=A0A5B7II18_PORTR|nr:hypothetical protein [Portunus trituberculatus]
MITALKVTFAVSVAPSPWCCSCPSGPAARVWRRQIKPDVTEVNSFSLYFNPTLLAPSRPPLGHTRACVVAADEETRAHSGCVSVVVQGHLWPPQGANSYSPGRRAGHSLRGDVAFPSSATLPAFTFAIPVLVTPCLLPPPTTPGHGDIKWSV